MTIAPGRIWRGLRRLSQCAALVAILLAPLLGGWQRLDSKDMALWSDSGWNLPEWLQDRLPDGDEPDAAYDALVAVGGGSGAEYVGIPAIDPVAGIPALLSSQLSLRFVVALAIPLVLAILGGRLFCGWLCPFGWLSRGLESGLERLPWRRRHRQRRRAIPDRRPLRWIILIGSLVASALGVQIVLFLFLPHLLMQQTLYSVWLLGGGGVILGLFLGLVVAGIVLGPTAYCAALCPTGAFLSLVGRKKVVRLTLAAPTECGKHCSLCDSACWLQLHPASGDAGPDCDSCARCITACPSANLELAIGQKARLRHLPVISAMLVGVMALAAGASRAQADELKKPGLVLESEILRPFAGPAGEETVTFALSLVDQRGIELDPDARQELVGIEVSVYVMRQGGRVAKDESEFYRGPLVIRVGDETLQFSEPNAPRSTPTRSIYRRVVGVRVEPGTKAVLEPIPGWLDQPVTWRVPRPGAVRPWFTFVEVTLGAALFFAGLLALALSVTATPRAGKA